MDKGYTPDMLERLRRMELILPSDLEKLEKRLASHRHWARTLDPLSEKDQAKFDRLLAGGIQDYSDLSGSMLRLIIRRHDLDSYQDYGPQYRYAVWCLERVVGRMAQMLAEMRETEPDEDQPPTPVEGWIYFIEAGGYIKIGFTAVSVASRIAQIETSSPHPVTLLRQERGTVETEREYHRRFSDLRERREWFRCEGDLAEFLTSVGGGGDG